jgi:hypothetical protein
MVFELLSCTVLELVDLATLSIWLSVRLLTIDGDNSLDWHDTWRPQAARYARISSDIELVIGTCDAGDAASGTVACIRSRR